jgi:hypothetical protein
MNEIFPVMMGATIGALLQLFASGRARVVGLILLSLLAGFVASAISGELEISLGFILIDVGQVLLVGALTMAAVAVWQRRSSRI